MIFGMELGDFLLKIIVPCVNIILTGFGVPMFVKIGGRVSERGKQNQFTKWVKSAEQQFGGKSGQIKFNYVARQARKKYNKMDSEELRDYIEEATKELAEREEEIKTQNEQQRKRYREEYKVQEEYQSAEAKISPQKRRIVK